MTQDGKKRVIVLNCCPLGKNEVNFWNVFFASFSDKFHFLFLSTFPTDGIKADECLILQYDLITFPIVPTKLSGELTALIQRVADKQKIWEAYEDSHSRQLAYSWLVTWTIILRTLKPDCVVAWNGHHVPEAALKEVCSIEEVDFVYAERGPFSGTFALDRMGINYESNFSKAWVESNDQISDTRVNRFREIYFREGQSNWQQPERCLNREEFCERLGIPSHKVVLFFPAQVDRDSNTKLFSPHYESTMAAFSEVRDWCNDQAEEIYLLAKKHPMEERTQQLTDLDIRSGAWVEDLHIFDCIQYCDCVVTINSSAAVEAALAGKPVLLLGNSILGRSKNVLALHAKPDLGHQLGELTRLAKGKEVLSDAGFFSQLLFDYLYSAKEEFVELGLKKPSQFPIGATKSPPSKGTILGQHISPLSFLFENSERMLLARSYYEELLEEAQRAQHDINELRKSFWVRVLKKLRMISA